MTRIESSNDSRTGQASGVLRFLGEFSLFGLSVHPHRCDKLLSAKGECDPFETDCDCGGYNEAFMVQHWANFDPIR